MHVQRDAQDTNNHGMPGVSGHQVVIIAHIQSAYIMIPDTACQILIIFIKRLAYTVCIPLRGGERVIVEERQSMRTESTD